MTQFPVVHIIIQGWLCEISPVLRLDFVELRRSDYYRSYGLSFQITVNDSSPHPYVLRGQSDRSEQAIVAAERLESFVLRWIQDTILNVLDEFRKARTLPAPTAALPAKTEEGTP